MTAVPESLKAIHGYVKLAGDTDSRDPVISYWIRVYVVQKALKIDSKSPEARAFLVNFMDRLEKQKESLKDNEAVTTDIVGQAHVENYGQNIFDAADREDRSGTASLKSVRAFLAAAQIFEVLSVFDEQTEEVAEKQRYAKYRASVIMKALKTGDKPPLPENIDGEVQLSGLAGPSSGNPDISSSQPSADFSETPPVVPTSSSNQQPVYPPSSSECINTVSQSETSDVLAMSK